MAVGTALVVALAMMLASATAALAKSPAGHGRSLVGAVSRSPAVKPSSGARLLPSVIGRAAGHKIA